MKIETKNQIEELRLIIGDENAEASLRALSDKAETFVFFSEEEINTSELSEEEKLECIKLFKDTNGIFAGWCRVKPILMPGFPDSSYDSHGNYRSNDGGCGWFGH